MAKLTNEASESQNELEQALSELGLSSTERSVYLTSLKAGPLSVVKLAEKVGLERPYVYTVIQSLREKRLASQSSQRYQKSFVVESPSVVLDLLRKKRTDLEALAKNVSAELPRYLAQYKQGANTTQVYLYEGKKRFLELYDRIFEEEPAETLYFGNLDHFINVVEQSGVETWMKRRIEKKIKMRFLPVESPRVKDFPTDPTQYRETRVIPKSLCDNVPATFQVFGNSVIFWQPETPAAIVLQDHYIAELHRNIFELLWKQGREHWLTPRGEAHL